MSVIYLIFYIFAGIGMSIECIKLINEKKLRSLIIGLALIFWIVPDFMMFNYWGIHISFVFVFAFSYILPALEAIQLKTLRFYRSEFYYILFLFLVLIYALLTPVLKSRSRILWSKTRRIFVFHDYIYNYFLYIHV